MTSFPYGGPEQGQRNADDMGLPPSRRRTPATPAQPVVDSEAAQITTYLKECAVGSKRSGSQFNQGVVRGLEIAAAQVEHGHYRKGDTKTLPDAPPGQCRHCGEFRRSVVDSEVVEVLRAARDDIAFYCGTWDSERVLGLIIALLAKLDRKEDVHKFSMNVETKLVGGYEPRGKLERK